MLRREGLRDNHKRVYQNYREAATQAATTQQQRAAAMNSLTGSPKLNGVDPEGHLAQVLDRSASNQIQRIEELLPWRLSMATGRALPKTA